VLSYQNTETSKCPRTATLTGATRTLGLKVAIAPLIPGTNQLTLTLTQHGQPRGQTCAKLIERHGFQAERIPPGGSLE
jgi:hypothetical protein